MVNLEAARDLLQSLGDGNSVLIDKDRRCGVPVLPGTRFSVAQLLAELATGRNVIEICNDFDLDLDVSIKFLNALASAFDEKMA